MNKILMIAALLVPLGSSLSFAETAQVCIDNIFSAGVPGYKRCVVEANKCRNSGTEARLCFRYKQECTIPLSHTIKARDMQYFIQAASRCARKS